MTLLAPATSPADSALLAAAKGGDRQALGELVSRHFGAVWAIGFARLGRRDAADDLTQEVFLVALLHLDSLRETDRFGAWVCQIARNRATDWSRQQRRASELVAMVPMEQLDQNAASESAPAVERADDAAAAYQAIFALPQEQREMVLLKFAEGLSQADIAQRLEIHPGTVGRNLEKAMANLRKTLDARLEEPVRRLRHTPRAAISATTLLVAVAGLSATSRAGLLAAAGHAPQLSGAMGTTALGAGKSIGTGAGIFSGAKLTALIISAAALAVGAAGVKFYAQSSTPSPAIPSSAPVSVIAPGPGVPPGSGAPINSDAALIHEAYVECFPREVTRYLFNDLPPLADQIQPAGWNTSLTGKLYVSPLATSVDQKSHVWTAYPFSAKSDGSGNLDLGYSSMTGPAGILTDPDEFVPLVRTPNQSILGGIAHRVLSLVGVSSFQAPYKVTAHVNGPWPAGESKKFLEISQWQSGDAIGPDLDGLYRLHLQNSPGSHCIQQLIFVAPKGWKVKSSSQPAVETKPVGDFVVSVWEKEVLPKETFQVDLKLNRTPTK